jgi:glycosyltransferase involved in cell wall biosynthesis
MPDTPLTVPASPLKVLILTETYYPVVGGGETQARLLAEELSARGCQVSILTRRSDASFPACERFGDVNVHRVGPSGRGQLKKWKLALTTVPALLRARHTYDLLFVSGFRILGLPAVCVARLLGKRVVLKADSQGEMSGSFFGPGLAKFGLTTSSIPFRAFLRLRNAVLKRADALVAITAEGERELFEAGVAAWRVRRMPNGVDIRRFGPASDVERSALRRCLQLPATGPVAIYTGRLVSYKGLPLLLTAWRSVVAQDPSAVLLIVGEGGLDIHNCEQELRQRVHKEGLERNVVFTGSVPDVERYLRASDVFAYPTENDAFPSSLVEAMACGLAVVTTPVGAIPEILADGVNGILVEQGDPATFRDALTRVLRDPVLARRLGEAARNTVLANYAAPRLADRYAELFRSLIAGSTWTGPTDGIRSGASTRSDEDAGRYSDASRPEH